ncbi:GNAT family N-acetyltransferase [Streptomyces sp. NPDC057307]|uniref:GNAT family N-acetyltransferase n=1 Tax=Streptomyces sp. NPDC057307 TaxID=3346096 RepID=UPI003639FF76
MDADNPGGLRVRRADASDWAALAEIDSVAAAGDDVRRDSIRRWCERGLVLLAEDSSAAYGPSVPLIPPGPLGYAVLEYTFFEQGFLTLLMVSPDARRRGVGAQLLTAVEAVCTTPKLFTSTNVSNHPMRRLLNHAGWRRAGILHGLDEGDPELFYLCPNLRARRRTREIEAREDGTY